MLTGTITVGTVSGGGTIAVGDFLLVTTMPAASGGWGYYLTGLMKVASVAGTSIGVTMPAYVNGIPSGTVTGGTLTVLKTRLTLTGTYTSAFQLTTNNPGTSSLGLLQNMAVIVGPDITTTNAINGGKIFCSQIGVWQFQTGFAAQVGADIVAVNCAATSAVGFHASQGQIAVNNCVANGCMSGGFLAEDSGSIFGYAGVQTATGCGYGIYAGNGGQFSAQAPNAFGNSDWPLRRGDGLHLRPRRSVRLQHLRHLCPLQGADLRRLLRGEEQHLRRVRQLLLRDRHYRHHAERQHDPLHPHGQHRPGGHRAGVHELHPQLA